MADQIKILVVEDEPLVRKVVARSLREQGYNVLQAADGLEALEVAQRHNGAIHLLITDVIMPQMGGKDLADRLRPGRPEQQALIAVRADRAPWVRRQGTPAGASELPVPDGFEAYTVRFSAADTFAVELAGSGSDVIVLDPPDLRALVREHLAGAVRALSQEEAS